MKLEVRPQAKKDRWGEEVEQPPRQERILGYWPTGTAAGDDRTSSASSDLTIMFHPRAVIHDTDRVVVRGKEYDIEGHVLPLEDEGRLEAWQVQVVRSTG